MLSSPRVFVLALLFSIATSAEAQVNLLKNPNADDGAKHWRAFGKATVESCPNGSSCFVLREGGYFIQNVALPDDAVGKYAVLVGFGESDNVRADGSITNLPVLYGYMMNAGDDRGGRIYAYLSGQQMRSSAKSSGEWVNLSGVFLVKPGTARISFFLQQGSRREGPPDGTTRFDDLGLYIFADEHTARSFVGQGHSEPAASRVAARECRMKRDAIPPLYGLSLGMSLAEVLSVFPGSENDPKVQQAIKIFQTGNTTRPIPLLLNPQTNGVNPELQDVESFYFFFREQRVFDIRVHYSQPGGSSVDEFIEARRQLLNIPESSSWNSVGGNSSGKYLICDGVEVRFFLAMTQAQKPSRIQVVDTSVEMEFMKSKASSESQ